MKWFIVLLFVLVVASAKCPKGQSEWRGGCVVDILPEIAPPVKPSDEKPPEGKMPSYQREGVTIINAPNLADVDARMDQEKLKAEADGKKMAGIK